MEFEKFNWFFVDFLIYSFGRIKFISPVVEREICFAYQLTGFYMIRDFTERYFLTDYTLENHFYKPSVSRIFCVNSPVKVLSPRYEGPSTHLFCTSLLCMFIIYRKKDILGKHVCDNYDIVTGFIPDRPFVLIGTIYFSTIFVLNRS